MTGLFELKRRYFHFRWFYVIFLVQQRQHEQRQRRQCKTIL